LTKDYFHHGYPVNRSEAKEIGLKVADRNEELENLMWEIWCDLSTELKLREPHNPLRVLRENPACKALFAPLAVINLPGNIPPDLLQQVNQQILSQVQVDMVPPAPFETIHAVTESSRYASRFVTNGLIFGTRLADQQIRISTVNERQGWITVPLDEPVAVVPQPPVVQPKQRKRPKKDAKSSKKR